MEEARFRVTVTHVSANVSGGGGGGGGGGRPSKTCGAGKEIRMWGSTWGGGGLNEGAIVVCFLSPSGAGHGGGGGGVEGCEVSSWWIGWSSCRGYDAAGARSWCARMNASS